ncbi:MAG: guanylate kinase [Ilumatobacteraceae bacterium]
MSAPLVIIVSGPGGVGKGTIVSALVERDSSLWLSRSWTTRAQREGESGDAYVFTTRDDFEQHIDRGGFLEWTDFLGNYYGTPLPEPPPGRDVVLEIELQGAKQVRERHPDALLIFVLPPSRDEQQSRLTGRGDAPDKVLERLRTAEEEEPEGKELADHVVINDDLERTIAEMAQIIEQERLARSATG